MIQVSYISPDGTLIEVFEMADGMTLQQAACTICPDDGGKFPVPVIAIVGDKPAVRDLGDWDFILSGANVQFRQLAMGGGGGGGGGGSNPMQVVMQVAVIALAAVATWYVGGTGAVLGIEALGLGSLWGGLAGAGVMLLGTMLMGTLFQAKVPSLSMGQMGAYDAAKASPTYSINASGNQARLYQNEPEGFGRMKIVPDFVAQTWTQYVGNDQIGYFVYSVGRGLYEIETLQFGETVFWRDGALVDGTGYEIQDIQFALPGEAVTIFPDNVVTSNEVSGQELFAPNDAEYSGVLGPYTTNPAGTETDTLLLDFIFQQGIGYYNDSGKLLSYTVNWDVEYRRIDDFGNALSDWALLESCTYSGATLTPQRMTKTYNVTPGRYEVRVGRTSNTRGDGRTMDSLVWGALRAMLPGTLTYPQSVLAFSIKASNALTQNASTQFSIIATRKLPLYDRVNKVWSEPTATRSWAAAISHVCKCQWGGRLADSNLDLDTLWSIDEKLQAKGWHYDSYLDGPYLVWPLLNEMCQSQCVIPRFVGPMLSFVQDGPDRPPTFALTPRNIVRGSFAVNYVTWSDDTPDDVIMDYLDADYGFQQRDVTASLPESESQEPASLSILGITNRSHAHKVAVAYAAHNRWQRIVVDCQVEALGRIINRGDICTVAHPRFKNTSAGAVTDWNEADLTITLQKDMTEMLPEGADVNSLYLALQKPDGSVWGACKLTSLSNNVAKLDSADYATLLLQGQDNPFEWITAGVDRQPTTWTLYTSNEYQRLMIVKSVSTQDALHFNISLGNYDPRMYQYNELPVPPWQGRGQLPVEETIDAPTELKATLQSDSTLLLTWLSVPSAQWYEVQSSSNGREWVNHGRTNVPQMTIAASVGIVWIRVRAASDRLQSDWAIWSGDSSIPVPAAPVPVLSGAYSAGEALITWQAVEFAEKYVISILHDDAAVYTESSTAQSFALTPELQEGGPWRELQISVAAVGLNGTSGEGLLAISDPAPEAVTDAVIETGAGYISLQSVTPEPADLTGYVLAKSETTDLGLTNILEIRQTPTLPYVWAGLEAGRHYFLIACRDAFYDLTHDLNQLMWSEVFEVEVPSA